MVKDDDEGAAKDKHKSTKNHSQQYDVAVDLVLQTDHGQLDGEGEESGEYKTKE